MTNAKSLHANREHKSRVFEMLFSQKQEALSLYNAVNNTDYTDPEALNMVTIEDALYMSMKNDVAFIVASDLNLYEHQSTYNPNMPLRGLFYLSRLYEAYVEMNGLDIYSSTQLKLPKPQFIVFYNGEKNVGDCTELNLSDAFPDDGKNSHLEVTAVMLNINYGHNKELMDRCNTLREYALLISRIREFRKQGLTLERAISDAIDYCIKEDVLRDFLIKNRAGVKAMILTEFDEALHEKTMRELGREEGRAEERKAGELRLEKEREANELRLEKEREVSRLHLEKERESNIEAVISMCQNMQLTKEQALEQLLKAFSFDEATLVTYLDRFWKQ